MQDILRRTTSVERSKFGDDEQSKVSTHSHQVEAARSISEKLWSVPDEHDAGQGSLDKQGSITAQDSEDSSCKKDGTSPAEPSSSTADALLLYQAFKKKNANEWLRRLQAENSKKRPSAEQLEFIKAVVSRCVSRSSRGAENC